MPHPLTRFWQQLYISSDGSLHQRTNSNISCISVRCSYTSHIRHLSSSGRSSYNSYSIKHQHSRNSSCS